MEKTICPKCNNKYGFAFGTCIDCGYNYLDKTFHWIKVYVKDLHSYSSNSLINKHENRINNMKIRKENK